MLGLLLLAGMLTGLRPAAAAGPDDCDRRYRQLDLFRDYQPGARLVTANEREYLRADPRFPNPAEDFGVAFNVFARAAYFPQQELISMHFRLRLPPRARGQERYLKGKEEFSRALRHFEDQGMRIRTFEAEWKFGDNLEAFNSYMEEIRDQLAEDGLSLDDLGPERIQAIRRAAAFSTWSGAQARAHGFTEVEFISDAGGALAGTEEAVIVRFRRPDTYFQDR